MAKNAKTVTPATPATPATKKENGATYNFDGVSLQAVQASEKASIAINSVVATALPVHLVKKQDDADFLIRRATNLGGLFDLAKCKLFALVRNAKMYEPKYKSFPKWAEDEHGLKKATAYAYAKMGAFINENGTGSIYDTDEQKLDYSKLLMAVEAFVEYDGRKGEITNDEPLKAFLTEHPEYFEQTAQQARKTIDSVKGLDKSKELKEEDATPPTETETNTEDETETETEETTTEKVEYVKIEKKLYDEIRNTIAKVIDESGIDEMWGQVLEKVLDALK